MLPTDAQVVDLLVVRATDWDDFINHSLATWNEPPHPLSTQRFSLRRTQRVIGWHQRGDAPLPSPHDRSVRSPEQPGAAGRSDSA